MCELQQGTQVVFSVDGTYEVVSVPRFSAPIPVIDDTDLADTSARPKCAGQLQDPQLMSGIVLKSIGTADRPTKRITQTLTITHAIVPGNATAEIFAGAGFIVDVREPEFSSDSENRKTIEVDWQYDGNPMPARTKATAS